MGSGFRMAPSVLVARGPRHGRSARAIHPGASARPTRENGQNKARGRGRGLGQSMRLSSTLRRRLRAQLRLAEIAVVIGVELAEEFGRVAAGATRARTHRAGTAR